MPSQILRILYIDVHWWRNCRSLHLPPCPCPRTQQAEGQLSSPPAAAYWLFKTDLRCIFTLYIIVFICPPLKCIYMISSGSGIKVIYEILQSRKNEFVIFSRLFPGYCAAAGRGSLLHTKDAPHFLLMTFPRESRKMLLSLHPLQQRHIYIF